MQRILFVDDDLHLLDGLRRRLSGLRSHWDMIFAGDPAAALRECDRCPFDLIVSDLRMRDGNGVMLLATVAERWPATARVVLSGVANGPISSELTRLAHQLLAKPGDRLEEVIERIGAARLTIPTRRTGELMGRATRIPAFAPSYRALVASLRGPSPSIEAVVGAVSSDPALAAKALQLVNSDFFGPGREVVSVGEAVQRLGVRLLTSLTLDYGAFGTFELGPSIAGFDPFREQRDAVRVARLARRVASDPELADAAYTAGLLHGVGRLHLATVSLAEAEARILGVGHAEVGGYLLALWGLPANLVEAVRDQGSEAGAEPGRLVRAVQLAVALIHDAEDHPGRRTAVTEPMARGQDLPRWRRQAELICTDRTTDPDSARGRAACHGAG